MTCRIGATGEVGAPCSFRTDFGGIDLDPPRSSRRYTRRVRYFVPTHLEVSVMIRSSLRRSLVATLFAIVAWTGAARRRDRRTHIPPLRTRPHPTRKRSPCCTERSIRLSSIPVGRITTAIITSAPCARSRPSSSTVPGRFSTNRATRADLPARRPAPMAAVGKTAEPNAPLAASQSLPSRKRRDVSVNRHFLRRRNPRLPCRDLVPKDLPHLAPGDEVGQPREETADPHQQLAL